MGRYSATTAKVPARDPAGASGDAVTRARSGGGLADKYAARAWSETARGGSTVLDRTLLSGFDELDAE